MPPFSFRHLLAPVFFSGGVSRGKTKTPYWHCFVIVLVLAGPGFVTRRNDGYTPGLFSLLHRCSISWHHSEAPFELPSNCVALGELKPFLDEGGRDESSRHSAKQSSGRPRCHPKSTQDVFRTVSQQSIFPSVTAVGRLATALVTFDWRGHSQNR